MSDRCSASSIIPPTPVSNAGNPTPARPVEADEEQGSSASRVTTKTKATHVGWIFEPIHYPEVGAVFSEASAFGCLDSANWKRRRVFVLDPEPEIEVEIEGAPR